MSEILTKDIVNCETGEKYTVPLTEEEILEIEEKNNIFIAEKNQIENKEIIKQSGIAKLIALGLTEEEAEALVK